MAKLMKELSHLPVDSQSKILSALSSENTAIEINDKLYVVPIQVMKLISSLNSDIEDLEEVINKGINEISVYKKD
jgi:hypothetical protein